MESIISKVKCVAVLAILTSLVSCSTPIASRSSTDALLNRLMDAIDHSTIDATVKNGCKQSLGSGFGEHLGETKTKAGESVRALIFLGANYITTSSIVIHRKGGVFDGRYNRGGVITPSEKFKPSQMAEMFRLIDEIPQDGVVMDHESNQHETCQLFVTVEDTRVLAFALQGINHEPGSRIGKLLDILRAANE